jgi:oligoendopeptidase F
LPICLFCKPVYAALLKREIDPETSRPHIRKHDSLIRDAMLSYLHSKTPSSGMAHATVAAKSATSDPVLGALPVWDLSHLYAGMDAPKLKADIAQAQQDAAHFADTWRGKLVVTLAGTDASVQLAKAIVAYEQLDDAFGRIMSYAGLIYSGDTTDPQRAKFYGDMQETITAASTQLLFFTLELNRLDDAALDAAASTAPLLHYKPWLDDIRKDKPHQLDDKIEELFHEKTMTGRAAWNRLFDETIASLRFKLDGQELTLELALNRLQDSDQAKRKAAALEPLP